MTTTEYFTTTSVYPYMSDQIRDTSNANNPNSISSFPIGSENTWARNTIESSGVQDYSQLGAYANRLPIIDENFRDVYGNEFGARHAGYEDRSQPEQPAYQHQSQPVQPSQYQDMHHHHHHHQHQQQQQQQQQQQPLVPPVQEGSSQQPHSLGLQQRQQVSPQQYQPYSSSFIPGTHPTQQLQLPIPSQQQQQQTTQVRPTSPQSAYQSPLQQQLHPHMLTHPSQVHPHLDQQQSFILQQPMSQGQLPPQMQMQLQYQVQPSQSGGHLDQSGVPMHTPLHAAAGQAHVPGEIQDINYDLKNDQVGGSTRRTYHKCPVVGCPWNLRNFSRKSELRKHCFENHLNKGKIAPGIDRKTAEVISSLSYKCNVSNCGKHYSRSDSLKRHIKLIHNRSTSRFNRKLMQQGILPPPEGSSQ